MYLYQFKMNVQSNDTIFRAIWNAATNAATCGFSVHPLASLASISAILIIKIFKTLGGSSTVKIKKHKHFTKQVFHWDKFCFTSHHS